jgi:hypothetical protein
MARVAAASDLPALIEAEIAELKTGCSEERVTLDPGPLTRNNRHGDGVEDSILDHAAFDAGVVTSSIAPPPAASRRSSPHAAAVT